MSSNNSDELDLFELIKKVLPNIGCNQSQLDNPTNELVSLFYQEFRNHLHSILCDALKDIEPDEGKRTDVDTMYALVRFINFTTTYIYPNIDATMTFKLLHVPSGKMFKFHARPLLKVLWNFELEFIKIKDLLMKRIADSKKLQVKRLELDNRKKKLAAYVSEIAANESTYKDLQKNNEKVQVRFKKLNQKQDAEKQTSDKLKEEVKSILEEYDNKEVLFTNIKTNIQHLNKQIVTEESYKALLSLKENINRICTELTNEEGSVQENLRGKTLDIERLNTIELHINELYDFAQALKSTYELYSKKLVECKHIHKIMQELSEKTEALNISTAQLKDKIKTHKELIQTNNLQNTDMTGKLNQELLELKEASAQEKELQDHQLKCKRRLEKTLVNLNKNCLFVKNEVDSLNKFHKHLYQKIISIENTNTENLSNALLELYNVLKMR